MTSDDKFASGRRWRSKQSDLVLTIADAANVDDTRVIVKSSATDRSAPMAKSKLIEDYEPAPRRARPRTSARPMR